MQHDRLLCVAVGNTRTRFGLFNGTELTESGTCANISESGGEPAALDAAVEAIGRLAGEADLIVCSSVNEPFARPLRTRLAEFSAGVPLRVGVDVPIPMHTTVRDPAAVGHDRLLNALAAHRRAEQACAVIDVGTAVTVDFIDGQGVFQGGLIAPGLKMMVASLTAGTAQIGEITYERPGEGVVFGGDTAEAVRLGVTTAVRGLVRQAVEGFAITYGGYPQVIATGGDAGVLEDDGLVEHFVPDLQLMGIAACVTAATKHADVGDDDGPV